MPVYSHCFDRSLHVLAGVLFRLAVLVRCSCMSLRIVQSTRIDRIRCMLRRIRVCQDIRSERQLL